MKQICIVIVLLLVVVVPVFAQNDMMPDVIELERTGFLPEGIEYDAEGERFLVGSLTEGTIFEFGDDGELSAFIEDSDLVSSVGIHIDENTNRLLVANSNAAVFFSPEGAESLASLAAYDLESGERLFLADFTNLYPDSPIHFANDVTADSEGNAYVTDSGAPVIYQVTPDGEASIFAENEQFTNPNFGLNGIEYHPDGYLLAAVAGSGSIFKIPLDDPANLTKVETDMPYSIDGMEFDPNLDLVTVANIADGQAIVMLSSMDDWASASPAGIVPTDGNATTVAIRGDSAYYTKGYFNNPGQEVYDINRVTLMALMSMDDDMMGDDDMGDDDMGDDDMGDDDMGDDDMGDDDMGDDDMEESD